MLRLPITLSECQLNTLKMNLDLKPIRSRDQTRNGMFFVERIEQSGDQGTGRANPSPSPMYHACSVHTEEAVADCEARVAAVFSQRIVST